MINCKFIFNGAVIVFYSCVQIEFNKVPMAVNYRIGHGCSSGRNGGVFMEIIERKLCNDQLLLQDLY